MRLSWLGLGFITLTACTSCITDDGEIRLSIRGGTPEQRTEIMESPAVWNEVVRPRFRFRFDDADPEVFIIVHDLSPYRESWPGVLGYWDGDESVHIDQALEGDTLQMVSSHELGHVLGLEHHAGPGIMFRHAGQLTVSDADLAECRRVESCP